MIPTMQNPATSWNPETGAVRSNGVGRQTEMFGNQAVGATPVYGNPFVAGFTPTYGVVPTIPTNPFVMGGVNPAFGAVVPQTPYVNYPYPNFSAGLCNPLVAINPITGIPTPVGINSTIPGLVSGFYPTTNPYQVVPTIQTTGVNMTGVLPNGQPFTCPTPIGVPVPHPLTAGVYQTLANPFFRNLVAGIPVDGINGLAAGLFNSAGIGTNGTIFSNTVLPTTWGNPYTSTPYGIVNPLAALNTIGMATTFPSYPTGVNPFQTAAAIAGLNSINPFSAISALNPVWNTLNPWNTWGIKPNPINPIIAGLNPWNTTLGTTALHPTQNPFFPVSNFTSGITGFGGFGGFGGGIGVPAVGYTHTPFGTVPTAFGAISNLNANWISSLNSQAVNPFANPFINAFTNPFVNSIVNPWTSSMLCGSLGGFNTCSPIGGVNTVCGPLCC